MIVAYLFCLIFTEYSVARALNFKGWGFFIPGYNLWVVVGKVTGDPKKSLFILLSFVPIFGPIAAFVFLFIWWFKLSKMLSDIYTVNKWLIFFFAPIVLPVCAFKDAPNRDNPFANFVTKFFKLAV